MASGQPPFFYHILINPFSPHLPLPVKFVKKHLKNRILKKPILKSANGGYLWKLKMKKFDDDSFCFVDGWCKVVKDVGFLFGEFLLFKYVGSSVFLMHAYSVNGCEKILVPRINKKVDVEVSVFDDDEVEDEVEEDDDDYDEVEEDDEDVPEEDEEEDDDDDEVELGDDDDEEDDGEDEDDVDVDGDDGDPFFVITSSKRNRNKLRFPPDLVAMAKIRTKETITLKNDDGYEKEMPVRSYKQNKSTRYYVAEGWQEFQRSNNISEGDECVLKFITSEDKICLARVTKKRTRATEVVNDDMDDDDGMDEGEAEDAKEDDSNVNGDDISNDDMDDEGKAENAKFVNDDKGDEDEDDDSNVDGDDIFDDDVDDEGKGENAKLVNEDEDDDEDDHDVDGDDGDPSFILTSTKKDRYHLRFSADFVALAGINTKKTITLKNLDGYENKLRVRSHSWQSRSVQFRRRNRSKSYFLSAGWKEFQRNSNISEGDKFVFKFITSEDKFCVAKITNNITRARPLPPAVEPVIEVDNGMYDQDVDDNDDMDDDDGIDEEGEAEVAKEDDSNVDGDDVFDDDMDGEGMGEKAKLVNENEGDEDDDGNDGDPSFILTISDKNQYVLRFSADFAALVGISTKKIITLKNFDGYEKELHVRSYVKSHRGNQWKYYYLAPGWKEFQQNSNISKGDKFVFKFITSEDKFCLTKFTKEKTRARPHPPATEAPFTQGNDGMGDQDVDDNDDMDDDDDDRDVDGDDGDPSFILTCSNKNQYKLYFSADFVELAGIDTKDTITLKNLDGYEKELHVRSQSVQTHRRNQSKNYYLAAGWKEFQRNSNISEGDKFVFKFITSEDKFCVAKITKNKTPARPLPPADEALVTEVDDGMDEEGEAEDAKEDDSNVDGDDMFGDDVNDDEDDEDDDRDVDGDDGDSSYIDMDNNDVMDANEDVELFDDGNPSFVATITPTYNHVLRMPADFVRLARLDTKTTLTLKSLDGYEKEMPLRVEKREPARYYVGSEWKDILQCTSILEGDKYVFKFIVSEDKLCLANIIKKKTQARPQLPVFNDQVVEDDNDKDENEDIEPVDDTDPFFVVDITTSHKCMLRLPPDFVELAGIDGKKNIIIKCLDGNDIKMALRPVKQGHLTRYCLSMGWPAFKRSNNISEGDECVFKYITSEDKMSLAKVTKKVTPSTEVDDNYLKVDDGKKVVVDDNKDEDENVGPVDDGMDVVVDDNKGEDEIDERVDDGMDGKDVVVDDYKGEDENVEPVDDGMHVVVNDNKEEDKNVKLADDGMYVEAYDNKDADKDVEFVVTITPSHKSKLRLPIDFVASAGIESKENVIMKSLDGNETQMSIRTDKLRHRQRSKQYHLSVGWPAFKRSNNISEGDECVFMYATSEDKMCLANITKRENVHVDDNTDEDEYVELVDGMDDEDVNEDVELVGDEDPFFRVTITPSHKSMLRLPPAFVGLAGINTKKTMIIKSLDGNESQMAVRSDQRFNSAQYHLAMGWVAFKQRNNLSLGDECVFKYITSEDKLCLAKVTKTSATETDDPFFVVTITPSHKSMLWLPIDFTGLSGIDTKENVIVKSLDGNETQMALRSYPFKKKQRYCFSIGWGAFKRSNNISEGDECVFKFITSEDKMCLAKVNKKKTLAKVNKEKTETSLPSPAEVVKRKRGRLPPPAEIKMTAAENVKMRSRRPPPVEITVAEAVKRMRGLLPPLSARVTKDVKSNKDRAAV